jgi:hypothetical protein
MEETMSTKKTLAINAVLIGTLLLSFVVAIFGDRIDSWIWEIRWEIQSTYFMDSLYEKGEVIVRGCADDATFTLEGDLITALCDGDPYYSERVENPEEYKDIVNVHTNMSTLSTNVEIKAIYAGANKSRLTEIWVFDWNQLPEKGCWISNHDFTTCPAYSLIWSKFYSPFHNFQIGDHVYGTKQAGQTIGDLIPEGAEAIVIDATMEHIKVRFVDNGREDWANIYWFTDKKPVIH